ncbi:torso-like protein isoform X1 [Plutella xylostella]|uniref:torso-like protein isoform X1 n=1 Tax=Plutella xylostella TaxID=51655 RepID=UPI0005D0DBF5|nr:torso-like protein isoform X1 [Plutella xylostella]
MVQVLTVLLLAVALTRAASTLDSELDVGKAINIFMRYGYLSICMRVVPRNDTESWVFREPTVRVFRHAARAQAPGPRAAALFHGDFHMEFCDNLKQLLQAYFRDFSFERLERPWRAFTAGWPPHITARNLGINASYVTGDHCYVLVRVSRYRETAKLKDLPNNIPVEDVVYEAINESTIGDTASIADFIRKYGSHYIASYITGNSLYQVFVFSRAVYSRIKERVKSKGIADIPPAEMTNFFSPFFAEHVGEVKVASGNKTVESWAMKRLRVHYYIFSYPSLLKLHGEPALLKNLDTLLGNEALLQLDLKTLSPAFKDTKKRKWFEEVIDNYLKLWESNM